MTDADDRPFPGRITIDSQVGSDPADGPTYGWQIRAGPTLPDDIVAALLREIATVY